VHPIPTAASVVRLVGVLLIEQNDEWQVGRRYFSRSSMALLDAPPTAPELMDDTPAPAVAQTSERGLPPLALSPFHRDLPRSERSRIHDGESTGLHHHLPGRDSDPPAVDSAGGCGCAAPSTHTTTHPLATWLLRRRGSRP
jgi:hypothetical protein